jgi:hypothetical protein
MEELCFLKLLMIHHQLVSFFFSKVVDYSGRPTSAGYVRWLLVLEFVVGDV